MNLKEFTLHLIEPNPLVQQLRQHFYATNPSIYANAHFLTDTFDEKFQFLNSNFIKIFQAVEQQHPDKMKDSIFFFDQVSRIGPHGLSTIAFYPPVKLLASDEQLAKWEKLILEGRLVGAYAQTEVAHGSDVQSLQTKAVYDNEKKCFVFNSPGTGATKFWVGVLGMHATHIVTQAQTFINGKHYGLQTFVVPVRDPKTYKLFDGVEAGDIGAKLGLPYMDNGYLRFTNYHVPRENLLMKFLKVNEDGQVTAQGDKNAVKIGYGGMLGLRVMLIKEFIRDGYKGITTFYRNLKTAGQLGPIQRRKLLQEFGYIYAGFSTVGLVHKMHKKILQTIGTNLKEALADLDEFHIFVSGFKAFYAWECVEQLRKSTAERSVGNLLVGGTAHIYGDRVPAVTYEGDNVVMLQQTARGICKYMQFVESEKFSRIPHTFKFLAELKENLNKQPEEIKAKVESAEDLLNLDKIEEVINVIGLFSANENYERMKQGVISGESMNKLWNEKLQKSMVDMGLRVTRGLTFKMAKTNLTNENIVERGLQKKDLEIVQDLLRIYGLSILQKDLGVASRFNIGASPDKLEGFVKEAQEIVFKRLEGSVEYIGDSSPFSEDDLFYVRDYKQWTPRDAKKERLEKDLKEQAAKVQQCINSFSKL